MIIMCCIAEPLVGWSKGYFGDRRDTTLRVITHMLIFSPWTSSLMMLLPHCKHTHLFFTIKSFIMMEVSR